MNGLECLDRIMVERPCPVVMVSSLTAEGADATLEALRLGAVDFVPKPEGAVSLRMAEFAPTLVEKVRAAASAKLRASRRLREKVQHRIGGAVPAAAPAPSAACTPAASGPATGDGLVIVGTSTGGPPALEALLSPLPGDFSLAHCHRAAHAGEFYRPAGTTTGRHLRHSSAGGRASDHAAAGLRLHRPRRRGLDRLAQARGTGGDGGAVATRLSLASQHRPPGAICDGACAAEPADRCSDDRHGQRWRGGHGASFTPRAARPSPKPKKLPSSGACPANWSKPEGPTGSCPCRKSPSDCSR